MIHPFFPHEILGKLKPLIFYYLVANRMTETETKCRSMAMNDQLWTMFDKVHAQTSEFASFFENIGRFHNSS